MQSISYTAAPRADRGARSLRPFRGPAFALLAIALLLLSGCKSDTLVVGAVLPLSGPDQAVGEEARKGLELAAAEWVAKGNERLDLRIVDSAGDPAQAAAQLKDLFENQKAVAAFASGDDLEARALVDIATQAERLLILTAAEDQELGAASPFVYRLSTSLYSAGTKVATFSARKLDAKKAALIAQDERFAGAMESGFGPSFSNIGGEYLGSRVAEDLSVETVRELRKAKCDTIVLSGDSTWMQKTLETLRSASYKGHIFAPQSFATPSNLEEMGKSARGVVFAATAVQGTEAGTTFSEAYRQAHESEATIFAAEAYDTLNVFMTAAQERPAIVSEIKRGLRDQIKSFDGASGNIEFDETGAPKKFPSLYSLDRQLAKRDHEAFTDERLAKIKRLKNRISTMGAGSR